jgi:hypothetical protein
MMLHNNGWRITRDDQGYWLIPPTDVDPEQTPRKINPASPALRDLRRESDNTFAPAPATPPATEEKPAAAEPQPPPDEWEESA